MRSSSSSRTVFAALPFLYGCSRSGLSFVCGGMCRGTTATCSAVPTRVEMRRSVGGSIVTITYTEEGIESSEQQKKKREGSGGRSSVRVCLNSVCLQRVSSVQVRCVCLSFGCFTTRLVRSSREWSCGESSDATGQSGKREWSRGDETRQ